jgi:hypothetical protein
MPAAWLVRISRLLHNKTKLAVAIGLESRDETQFRQTHPQATFTQPREEYTTETRGGYPPP